MASQTGTIRDYLVNILNSCGLDYDEESFNKAWEKSEAVDFDIGQDIVETAMSLRGVGYNSTDEMTSDSVIPVMEFLAENRPTSARIAQIILRVPVILMTTHQSFDDVLQAMKNTPPEETYKRLGKIGLPLVSGWKDRMKPILNAHLGLSEQPTEYPALPKQSPGGSTTFVRKPNTMIDDGEVSDEEEERGPDRGRPSGGSAHEDNVSLDHIQVAVSTPKRENTTTLAKNGKQVSSKFSSLFKSKKQETNKGPNGERMRLPGSVGRVASGSDIIVTKEKSLVDGLDEELVGIIKEKTGLEGIYLLALSNGQMTFGYTGGIYQFKNADQEMKSLIDALQDAAQITLDNSPVGPGEVPLVEKVREIKEEVNFTVARRNHVASQDIDNTLNKLSEIIDMVVYLQRREYKKILYVKEAIKYYRAIVHSMADVVASADQEYSASEAGDLHISDYFKDYKNKTINSVRGTVVFLSNPGLVKTGIEKVKLDIKKVLYGLADARTNLRKLKASRTATEGVLTSMSNFGDENTVNENKAMINSRYKSAKSMRDVAKEQSKKRGKSVMLRAIEHMDNNASGRARPGAIGMGTRGAEANYAAIGYDDLE